MERSAFTTKRKKRKTRKCLDEMRKRSRRTNEGSISKKRGNIKATSSVTSKSNLVTMNRLTLAMFSKAVQSETITRPVLAQMKQNCNFNNVIENVAISSSSSNEQENNVIDNSCGPQNRDSVGEMEINYENQENNFIPDVGSHDENQLFSLTNNSEEKEIAINVHLSSSSMSQSSQECNLYDDLMNEISDYFKKITAAIVHEDVIKKTKIHLQKLYIESCQKEYENNILKCIRSNILHNKSQSNEEITHSNMNSFSPDIPGQNILRECPVSLSESSECELSPPALGLSSSSSEKELFSCPPETITSPELPISDSPEYIYYPHRLN